MLQSPVSTTNSRTLLNYFVLAICFTLVICSCEASKSTQPSSSISKLEQSRTPTETLIPQKPTEELRNSQPTNTSKADVPKQKTPSQYAALIFLSLLSERNTDPSSDPVAKICQGPMWLKLDENFSKSMGSSESYITTINQTRMIVGGSGTSDAFSVVISSSGDRNEILKSLSNILKIEGPIAEEPGIGDVMRIYKASANNHSFGLISFIEAADKSSAIGDLITLSFLSRSKLEAENLWDDMTKNSRRN